MAETWLRQRMSEIGIATTAELVRLLELEGLSLVPSTVGHWVNGLRKPKLQNDDTRRALARVLKLSESELLVRAGYDLPRLGRSKEAQIGAEIIDHLPPDKRDLAVRLLEQLRAG